MERNVISNADQISDACGEFENIRRPVKYIQHFNIKFQQGISFTYNRRLVLTIKIKLTDEREKSFFCDRGGTEKVSFVRRRAQEKDTISACPRQSRVFHFMPAVFAEEFQFRLPGL
ncbi:hypothetical protein CEXT_17321 [Caerostris extrusa]|uniref:Uncharacterized protein n=1 Tax=Caerostris extrusa TaxID=172846 RepID=A0AAV4PGP8_CAEEX|nr:hypothetical protein CEXT_17321 [Caerostris extrusa]